MPINKSHLRFNNELGYQHSQVAEIPRSARGSGGPK